MPAPAPIPYAEIRMMLARYGVTPARVQRVAHLGMQVFRVTTQEAPATGELALRIYGSPGPLQARIESELLWLQAMAQGGLHVPAPLLDREGGWIQSLPAAPDAAGPTRDAVLLQWLPGRCLTHSLKAMHARQVGTLLAGMHQTAQVLAAADRLVSTQLAHVPDLQAWAQGRRPHSPWISARAHDLACAAAKRLQAEVSAIPSTAPCFGYVHGDTHLWNLLFSAGQAGVIDFSDCGWGPSALDLAATLQYLKHPLRSLADHSAVYPRLRDELLNGYTARRAMPAGLERQIETCIGMRMINTPEWVLDDWPRPDHRAWGPAFLLECESIFAAYAG